MWRTSHPRVTRTLVSLIAVFALSAVTAASAAASPEFDAAIFPAEWKGTNTNFHGFSGGGAVIVCKKATFNTAEAKGGNPTKDGPSLKVHPVYTECRGSVPIATAPVEVRTTGCDYRLHAVAPGKPEGSFDIECEAGKRIEYIFIGVSGCTVGISPQAGVKSLEYKNEPKAGTETQEVTTDIEANKVKSESSSFCGLTNTSFEGAYRQGKIATIGGVETAEIEPEGHPAGVVFKGFAEATKAQEAIEVGINEAHWYTNGVPLPKQSGGPGEEGTDVIAWGTLVLTTVTLGTIECQNEFGGDAYNPEGAGVPPGAGMARAGEGKMDAFQAYDCLDAECETTLNSKLFIEAEGLGVAVVGGVAEALEWEAQLETVAGVNRLKVGNTTGNEKTRIKFHIVCPKTTVTELNSKAKGELTPEVENGSAIGAAPGKLTFGAGSGELEIGTTKEGKVTGKLKAMGYEGGEIIAGKHP